MGGCDGFRRGQRRRVRVKRHGCARKEVDEVDEDGCHQLGDMVMVDDGGKMRGRGVVKGREVQRGRGFLVVGERRD